MNSVRLTSRLAAYSCNKLVPVSVCSVFFILVILRLVFVLVVSYTTLFKLTLC